MDLSNVKKACTESLVLRVLKSGPLHGYDIAKEVERRSDGYFLLKHGTLYPILHRLEKDGLIDGNWSVGVEGERPRKTYALTAAGRRSLQETTTNWQEFFRVLRALIPEVAP